MITHITVEDAAKLISRIAGTNETHALTYIREAADRGEIQAADALEKLQAENEKLWVEAEGMRSNWYKSVEEIKKLRAELEQVKWENNALWTYIEIVDREYRRYMDMGYIDRLDELRRTWRRGQKEG